MRFEEIKILRRIDRFLFFVLIASKFFFFKKKWEGG